MNKKKENPIKIKADDISDEERIKNAIDFIHENARPVPKTVRKSRSKFTFPTEIAHEIELKIDELTNRQREILVKVQDPNFYNHKGVEFSAQGSGWTTITQSLAKKFYFKNFKQGIRKIKQTLCARYALDPLVDKDTQLELFINIIYFGNDCYGLKEASEYYFGKNPIDLTENEYISLIASLIAPSTINIKDNEKENICSGVVCMMRVGTYIK